MILGQRNANPMRNTRACQRAAIHARVRAEKIIEASRISHVFLCVLATDVPHSLKNLIIM
jgi:hypothetical protein